MKNKKPLWIALAALALILLLTAAASLLRAGKNSGASGGSEGTYPCSWTQNKDGSLTLKLDGSAAQGGVWSFEREDEDGAVSVSLGETKGGRATAKLQGAAEGIDILTFHLRSGDEPIAQTILTVEARRTDEAFSLAVVSAGERTMQSTLRGGEGTGFPFSVYTDGAGGLLLHIDDPMLAVTAEAEQADRYEGTEQSIANDALTVVEDDVGEVTPSAAEPQRWSVTSSNSLAAQVASATRDETGVEYAIVSVEDGAADVTASSEEANVTYTFSVEAHDGSLLLTDHSEGAYEPPQAKTEEELTAQLTEMLNSFQSAS